MKRFTRTFVPDAYVGGAFDVDLAGAHRRFVIWRQGHGNGVVGETDLRDRLHTRSMINSELERFMSRRAKSETIELIGSHFILLSHAKEVGALIEKAAKAAE